MDVGGGHYTAYGFNALDQAWYLFDDSRVTRAEKTDIISPQAYMLFYIRRGVECTLEKAIEVAKSYQDLPPAPPPMPPAMMGLDASRTSNSTLNSPDAANVGGDREFDAPYNSFVAGPLGADTWRGSMDADFLPPKSADGADDLSSMTTTATDDDRPLDDRPMGCSDEE